MAEALADVARLGPFFAVSTDPAEGADPRWRPVPEGVPALIEATAARLGVPVDRVAASTAQLALAARLWSPVLGCALLHGLVPDLAALRQRLDASGTVRLWLDAARSADLLRAGTPDAENAGRDDGAEEADVRAPAGLHERDEAAGPVAQMAAAVRRSVIEGQLTAVHEAVRARVPVAAGLLWGNAASAMIGALRVLAAAHPGLAGRSRRLARRLLEEEELRGSGVPAGPGLTFRRRSCCLYYRLGGGGLCGDCCFTVAPGS